MTKKHFVLFAKALTTVTPIEKRLEFCKIICEICHKSNPKFDAGLFRKAANCEDTVK